VSDSEELVGVNHRG